MFNHTIHPHTCFFLGPLCDTYGARLTMAFCLVLTAIPVMLIGIVHNATELYIIRLFTGISGSSFVICQYWTSSMFVREIAGTANSLASGWGNLGGGVAQIVIGSALFPLFKVIYGKESQDYAWRTIFIAPAICGIITAICLMKYSDDTPKGNYRKMHRLGTAPVPKIMKSFRLASFNMNTWILFIQYACCFGVEVTMTTGAAFYFSDAFDQTTESAAALASIFGWLNLFARGLGGFISDIMNVKFGMRGRLLWQVVSLVFEGALIICFGYAKTLAGSISTMIAFSLFVQTSEGSTYSIVPYVCPRATGSVAGIVGAGGNVGGVIFLFLITKLDYEKSFFYMGLTVIACSLLSFYINIAGYSRGLRKMDNVREVDIADGSDHDINGDEKEKSTNFETSGNAHTTSDTEQIRNETIP
jgi:NNP family nitrate/nitrite transporter-like MFS transporter